MVLILRAYSKRAQQDVDSLSLVFSDSRLLSVTESRIWRRGSIVFPAESRWVTALGGLWTRRALKELRANCSLSRCDLKLQSWDKSCCTFTLWEEQITPEEPLRASKRVCGLVKESVLWLNSSTLLQSVLAQLSRSCNLRRQRFVQLRAAFVCKPAYLSQVGGFPLPSFLIFLSFFFASLINLC